MIHRTAHFIVQAEHIAKALPIIQSFVKKVSENEEDCLQYRSLQSRNNPGEFIHYMIFETKKAEEHHRTTDYVAEFVDRLYPLLDKKPEFTSYSVVAG